MRLDRRLLFLQPRLPVEDNREGRSFLLLRHQEQEAFAIRRGRPPLSYRAFGPLGRGPKEDLRNTCLEGGPCGDRNRHQLSIQVDVVQFLSVLPPHGTRAAIVGNQPLDAVIRDSLRERSGEKGRT